MTQCAQGSPTMRGCTRLAGCRKRIRELEAEVERLRAPLGGTRKSVKQIFSIELPEPFKSYWNSPERLQRPYWLFFLVDGELYIEEKYSLHREEKVLLSHWTQASCCGVQNFMRDHGIKLRRDLPLVGRDGTFLFEIIHSADYETSARDPISGKTWCVHSG